MSLSAPLAATEETRAALLAAAKSAAMAELWRRRQVWPLLEALLDRDQLADARAIFQGVDIQKRELPRDDYVLDISRQRGKSWLCCVLVAVLGRCLPGLFVKYAAQEQKSVRAIVQPTMDAVFADCPKELRPRFVQDDSKWVFDNGSNITAAGCNNKGYVALRGQKAHIVVKDESGFYDDYDAVERVLAPQLQTTRGFSIDASTPPETPGHPYTVVAKAAKLRGRYSHRKIYNHPRMTPDEVEAFLTKEAGKKGQTLEQFKQTTYYLREFECQHVMEEGRAIVPEWAHVNQAEVVRAHPRPPRYTAYHVIDPGETRSLFVGLAGFWHFTDGVLVVERETVLRYPDDAEAGEALLRTEKANWAEDLALGRIDAILRRSDVAPALHKLLAKAPYLLPFQATEKDNAEGALNTMRSALAAGQIIIHPRCTTLLLTLETGIWNKQRSGWEYNDRTGHADAIAALTYMWRNVQKERNPGMQHTHTGAPVPPRAPPGKPAPRPQTVFKPL